MKLRVRAMALVAVAMAGWWGRPLLGVAQDTPLSFTAHTIVDTGLRGGYQTIVADLNKDGRPDIIALASGVPELAWFENTGAADSWPRHVIAAGLPGQINVAAHDIDKDGIPELAVGSGFSMVYGKSIGILTLFTHGADPKEPWTGRELDRTPTIHRLRWVDVDGKGTMVLINSVLIGSAEQVPPDYKGRTPVYYYQAPDWKRQTVTDAEEGVVHGLLVTPWEKNPGQTLLVAGFLGVHAYHFAGGKWSRTEVIQGDPTPWPKSGSSDVVFGRLAGQDRFLATIEPWHGNQVAVYTRAGTGWTRKVIDDAITDGHTLVSGDFDGDGRDEVVAGERGGKRSIYLYRATTPRGDTWARQVLDEGGMAGAGCAVADLNGDKKPDVVCIGTATQNLKWYRNGS